MYSEYCQNCFSNDLYEENGYIKCKSCGHKTKIEKFKEIMTQNLEQIETFNTSMKEAERINQTINETEPSGLLTLITSLNERIENLEKTTVDHKEEITEVLNAAIAKAYDRIPSPQEIADKVKGIIEKNKFESTDDEFEFYLNNKLFDLLAFKLRQFIQVKLAKDYHVDSLYKYKMDLKYKKNHDKLKEISKYDFYVDFGFVKENYKNYEKTNKLSRKPGLLTTLDNLNNSEEVLLLKHTEKFTYALLISNNTISNDLLEKVSNELGELIKILNSYVHAEGKNSLAKINKVLPNDSAKEQYFRNWVIDLKKYKMI